MTASEAQKRASIKYDKANTVQKLLKLNKKTDADILDWISGKNFQGYVKELIREDMKKAGD
jgi:hypothetical protein